MKTLRYLFAAGLLVLLMGCFKEVAYKTTYILKPLRQQTSGGLFLPLEQAKAFVCHADTAMWTVASYDDALKGVVTSRENPAEKRTAVAESEPYESEGMEGLLQMPLLQPSQLVIVVNTEDRIYAYTQQKLEVNLPKLYVSLPFRVWKEGTEYKDGNWIYRNEFYAPPTILECVVSPRSQDQDAGPEAMLSSAEVYAFAVDTTDWYIASYADAVGRKITSKRDPKQTRTNPEAQGYPDKETGDYKMNVKHATLMVVVADKSAGSERYAYSKQVVDLEGASVTFPVVFRTWKEEYLFVEQGWRVVNQTKKPADPTVPPSPLNKFSDR